MKKLTVERLIAFVFTAVISLSLVFTLIFNGRTFAYDLYQTALEILATEDKSESVSMAFSGTETAITENLFMRESYIDVYGGVQKLMNKKVIWDADPSKQIVVGSDGKLYFTSNITVEDTDISQEKEELMNGISDKLLAFNDQLKSRDIPLIYFQAPQKYNAEYVDLPIPTADENNIEKASMMFECINSVENLYALNYFEIIEKENMDYNTLFFKTDHHWTIETAFDAFSRIASLCNDELNYNIDESYYDIDNYTVNVYENEFLGSMGSRTGGWYVGRDDFSLISPKFPTQYTKKQGRLEENIDTAEQVYTWQGNFNQAILTFDAEKENTNVAYSLYLSDKSEIQIVNDLPATDKKLLVLKDSFGLPVTAFLSTCFSQTRVLDLRYHQDKSVIEYIDDYDPDCVVVIYSPGTFSNSLFNFNEPVE